MKREQIEIIKTFKNWIEITEEDGFVTLPEPLCKKILTIIEQMAYPAKQKGLNNNESETTN